MASFSELRPVFRLTVLWGSWRQGQLVPYIIGYIGVILGYIGDYFGIVEKKMETTIMGYIGYILGE